MSSFYGGLNQLSGGMTRTVRALLIANVAVYLLQHVVDGFTGGLFTLLFGLSGAGVGSGYIWQPVTYMFLHGSLMHLFLNMLVLFFMGPETERTMGAKHFRILYFLSGVLAGLAWLLISPGRLCIGASGAIFGILAAFAALYPLRRITVLLFFILPVTMQAWVLVVGLVAIELIFLITQPGGGIAHSVHLAGAVAGYVYTSTVFHTGAIPWRRWTGFRGPSRGRGRLRVMDPPRSSSAVRQAEIDRILEKIARKGVNSLSRSEKEMLESASQNLRGGR